MRNIDKLQNINFSIDSSDQNSGSNIKLYYFMRQVANFLKSLISEIC